MTTPRRPSSRASVRFWRDVRVLAIAFQVVVLLAVLLAGGYLINNMLTAMETRGFFPSLDFLGSTARFDIAEHYIPYDNSDTYGRALVVGLLNTLAVSIVGVMLATIIGLIVGIARLSDNWLVNKIALAYVELFRNTPLLLQLIVIYFAVFLALPGPAEAIELPGRVFLSKSGLDMPRPLATGTSAAWLTATLMALLIAVVLWVAAGRREAAGRAARGYRPTGVAILVVVAVMGWFIVGDAPLSMEMPVLGRFNFSGGLAISAEFAALTLGLALYTAAFIAEIVRGAIEAVSRGQREAARAIGLNESQTLRLVVLPQALRVIIPPLTSQYLNLIKNSSLALIIGFQDVFGISKTIITQTGQPVSVLVVVMAFYLVISLITSALMNLYNRRVQIKER